MKPLSVSLLGSPILYGLCAFATVCATCLWAIPSVAQEPPTLDEPPTLPSDVAPVALRLTVERAIGSESCPDSTSVFHAIGRLFPERAILSQSAAMETSVATARVQIRPISQGHEASITVSGPRIGERSIIDNDVNCRGLAPALAVNLVMLLEPSNERQNAPPPADVNALTTANPPSDAPPIAPSKPKEMPERRQDIPRAMTLRAASEPAARTEPAPRGHAATESVKADFIGTFGLLNQPAIGAAIGVDIFHRNGFGLAINALRVWSDSVDREGGRLKFDLWGGFIGPCYRQKVLPQSTAGACLRMGLGQQGVQATRFEHPRSSNVLLSVLGPSFHFTENFGKGFNGSLALTGFAHLRPQSFSVRSGSGTAAQPLVVSPAPKVGLMVELGFGFGGRAF